MGKRDKRRSRDRRRAKRNGLPTRPVKVKKSRVRLVQAEQPGDLLALLKRLAVASSKADAELRARPKKFSIEHGEVVVEPYFDIGTQMTYLPDGSKYLHTMR